MKTAYFRIHEEDNVAIALEQLEPGCETVSYTHLDMIRSILVHGRRAMTTQEVARLAYGMERVPADQAQFIKLKMVISKTFSCLEYLYEEDFALRTERDGVFYWEAP